MTEITNTVSEETFQIADFFADEMSPFGMRTSVNKILKAIGVDKELPGPMFYTYTKKGYIKTVAGSDNKRVAKSDAIEWTEAYLTKLAIRMQKEATKVVTVNEVQEALDALNESDEEVTEEVTEEVADES
jgi:hypothetical protein